MEPLMGRRVVYIIIYNIVLYGVIHLTQKLIMSESANDLENISIAQS